MPEITEKLRELAQTPWGKLVGLRELPHGWKLGIIRHAAKCRFEQDALAVALLWASGYGWQITCNDPRRTVVEVKGKYGRGDTLLKATTAALLKWAKWLLGMAAEYLPRNEAAMGADCKCTACQVWNYLKRKENEK